MPAPSPSPAAAVDAAVAAALAQRAQCPSVEEAHGCDLTSVAGVTFTPTGNGATDRTALAIYLRCVGGLVPCLACAATGDVPEEDAPVVAVLLRRVFDVTLRGAAAALVVDEPSGVRCLAMLRREYLEGGSSEADAVSAHRQAISDLAYDDCAGIGDYKAKLDGHAAALVALGKPREQAELAASYKRGLKPDRNATFDAAPFLGLWASGAFDDCAYVQLHTMIAAADPKAPKPRKAARALVAAATSARSGDAALADPTVAAAVSTIRAFSQPGQRCGNCGGVAHWTQLCPSAPGTRRANQRAGDARDEHDARGRVLCRNHKAGRCTRGAGCRFSHDAPATTTAPPPTPAPALALDPLPPPPVASSPPAANGHITLAAVDMHRATALLAGGGPQAGLAADDHVTFVDSGAGASIVPDVRGVASVGPSGFVATDGGGAQHPASGRGTYAGLHVAPDGALGPTLEITDVEVCPSFKFRVLSVSRLNQHGVGAHMPADGPAYLATRDGTRIHLARAGGLFALVTRPRLHSTAIALGAALGDPHSPFAHSRLALPWLSAVLAMTTTATPRLASRLAAPLSATAVSYLPDTAAAFSALGPYPPIAADAAHRASGTRPPDADAAPALLVLEFPPLAGETPLPAAPPGAALDTAALAVRSFPLPAAPDARGGLAPGAVWDAANLHASFGPHAAHGRAVESAAALDIPLRDVDGPCGCVTCKVANMRRSETHATSASPAAASRPPGHTWDFDLATDLKPTAVGGSVHALDGICATCGFVYTAELRSKDGPATLRELLAFVVAMRARGVDVRLVRFDSGREFTDEEVRAALAAAGCHAEYTTTDRHIENAERAHQILQRGERAVLRAAAANVPRRFRNYGRAYSAVAHNVTINSRGRASPANDGRPACPYVALMQQRPDLRALLPFGSQIAAFEMPAPPSSSDRAILATYLGPSPDHGPGAIWFLTDKTTVRATASFRYIAPPGAHLDATTLRPAGRDGPLPVDERPAAPPTTRPPTAPPPRRSTRTTARRTQLDPSPQTGGDAAWRDPASALVAPPAPVFRGTHADQPALYDTPDARTAEAAHHPTNETAQPTPDPAVPTSLRRACEPEHAATWVPAFESQLDAFRRHDTATPILRSDVPPGADIARSGVNFRLKRNGTGKARFFYDGSGVNAARRADPSYGAVSNATPRSSSPTAGYSALVFLCAVTAHFGSTILQDDINDAYLLGRRAAPVFMSFPYGMDAYMHHAHGDRAGWPYDPATHVLRVDGNIWGHPDAGAIWHAVIYPFLTSALGFTPTPLDPCLLYRHEPSGIPTLLLLFVDDFFVSAAVDVAWSVAARISARFETKGAHVADDALGVDIDIDPNGDVAIHAASYFQRTLVRFGFDAGSGSKTPLPAGFSADPSHRAHDDAGGSASRSFDPGEIAGCLVFAAMLRPDLAFAASSLASAVGCWAPKHDRAAARVLRYMKATIGRRLVFRHGAPLELAAWVDASFACDIHSPSSPGRCKSRSGCLIFFMGTVLWHASRRQTATALSSCEAELAALCLLVRALLVFRVTIAVVFGCDLPATPIYEDNTAVISIFRRGDVGGRMRHTRTAISFALDAIRAAYCYLVYAPSKTQLANTLTQAEPADRHAWALARLFPTA